MAANAQGLAFHAGAFARFNGFRRALAFVTALAFVRATAGFGGTNASAYAAGAGEQSDSRAHQDHQLFFHNRIILSQGLLLSSGGKCTDVNRRLAGKMPAPR